MDSPGSNQLIDTDIFEIYMRYCDIISRSNCGFGQQDHRQDGELGRAEFSREALGQLLKSVESGMLKRISVFDELVKLMLKLDFMVDFSEFSRFYDFVFFICRENGQKNITVSRAITGWKLVLAGRFRLLNQWCDFVEKNQRYNISEDTWRQVLAFSRCVHENLEGYDSEGAWPILIDDFVEHMYRISGFGRNFVFCNCSDSESKSCIFDAPRPGLKIYPGSKRKLLQDSQMDIDAHGNLLPGIVGSNTIYKRNRPVSYAESTGKGEENSPEHSIDNYTETVKHNSPRGSSKSPCAVEGCLSKGFATLFSNGSRLSYT